MPMILLFAVIACCPAWADAQARELPISKSPVGSLQLEQVLSAVNRYHPLLDEARQLVLRAQGDVLSARGGFDPVLEAAGGYTPYGDYVYGIADVSIRQPTPFWGASVFGGWRLGKGDFPVYNGDLITAERGEARVGIELPLLRDGPIDARRASLQASQLKHAVARYGVRTVALELQRQAGRAYWTWVAAGRKLSIAEGLLASAVQRGEGLRQRATHGDVAPIDQADNLRAVLKRQGALTKARRELEKATIKLSLYYRDQQQRPVRVPAARVPSELPSSTDPALAQLDHDITFALAHRPELQDVAIKQGLAQLDRDVAANQRLPKLNAAAVSALDVGDERYRNERGEVKLGLKFELPLQMRGARGKLLAATAEQGRLRAKARYLRDQIVAQVQDAHSALRAAHEQASFAERERGLAHQLEEAERAHFELGSSTLLIVNLREQDAAEAEQRAVDALSRYHQALSDYQAVIGRLAMAVSDSRS